jgi:hypothetical protein
MASKYSLKERLNLDDLYQTFLALAPRQQIFAGVGVGLVLLLMIVIPISCAASKLGKLQTQITGHEKSVRQVIEKITEYKNAQARVGAVEGTIKPRSEVQLTTRLESIATKSGIGANIDSLKEKPGTPGEDFEELVVDVRMSKLSLSQVIEFLYGVESQKDLTLRINRMQMRPRYDNRQMFDVSFEVSTLVAAGAGG